MQRCDPNMHFNVKSEWHQNGRHQSHIKVKNAKKVKIWCFVFLEKLGSMWPMCIINEYNPKILLPPPLSSGNKKQRNLVNKTFSHCNLSREELYQLSPIPHRKRGWKRFWHTSSYKLAGGLLVLWICICGGGGGKGKTLVSVSHDK